MVLDRHAADVGGDGQDQPVLADDHAVLLASRTDRDPAVARVGQHRLGIAPERIAVAAAPRAGTAGVNAWRRR